MQTGEPSERKRQGGGAAKEEAAAVSTAFPAFAAEVSYGSGGGGGIDTSANFVAPGPATCASTPILSQNRVWIKI